MLAKPWLSLSKEPGLSMPLTRRLLEGFNKQAKAPQMKVKFSKGMVRRGAWHPGSPQVPPSPQPTHLLCSPNVWLVPGWGPIFLLPLALPALFEPKSHEDVNPPDRPRFSGHSGQGVMAGQQPAADSSGVPFPSLVGAKDGGQDVGTTRIPGVTRGRGCMEALAVF